MLRLTNVQKSSLSTRRHLIEVTVVAKGLIYIITSFFMDVQTPFLTSVPVHKQPQINSSPSRTTGEAR